MQRSCLLHTDSTIAALRTAVCHVGKAELGLGVETEHVASLFKTVVRFVNKTMNLLACQVMIRRRTKSNICFTLVAGTLWFVSRTNP